MRGRQYRTTILPAANTTKSIPNTVSFFPPGGGESALLMRTLLAILQGESSRILYSYYIPEFSCQRLL